MRANYKLQRLFVDIPLAADARVGFEPAQHNYLFNVLRLKAGAKILLFNGRDGEWRAVVERAGKREAAAVIVGCERPQPPAPDLVYAFAPLKAGRLDYMVQKAVEMGAGVLQPVMTQHTQVGRVNVDKMRANAIEAAEQCGVLAIPECRAPLGLDAFLAGCDEHRALVFCDEAHADHNPLAALAPLKGRPLGLLIGPEGGFSDSERATLRALPFVTAIALGPRILRADTAAVAALALVQAVAGDWD
ncbi:MULTISPECIES: 16S rRNA (uracil(1498)-N(3))-methyltransferase [unclassified Roseitalea]|uniref:16S rRNA (uracil(1498)-N(3))-methyltransferase n=1 Tax=unclassified Roseitalea TaxID=2639107 RepID=UPI00273D8A36|nr:MULTISPECIES: 16S rRNA (uracil(1498)-N(3))-methyltransferase [unclassified Roseitalea]